MPRLRPRISLLTAFLLTAAVALSIVVVRQHGEIATLRQDSKHIPSYWKSRPQVLDESRLYGIEAVDIQSLLWTWRLWIPRDAAVKARFKWGDVPAEGYPSDARSIEMQTGNAWLALKFDEHPVSGESLGQLFGLDSDISFIVPSSERLSPWWKPEYKTDVLSARTLREDADGRLLLQRFRVVEDNVSENSPSTGFIIWLERR
jgi:hypothetical protein